MNKQERKELHNKYWDFLDEKGLKLGEKIQVRAAFVTASGYKEEHPFIERVIEKDRTVTYRSEHKEIKSFAFHTRQEGILVKAIYENVKHNFNPNTFREMFRYTFRILGVDSVWAE